MGSRRGADPRQRPEGGEPTAEEVAAAYAAAAIKVVDSPIIDWKIAGADTIADNGSSAFFLLGPERRSLDGLDFYACSMALERNGAVVSVNEGGAGLGNPLNAASWLAGAPAAPGRAPTRRGSRRDIVFTGALGPSSRSDPAIAS